MPVIDHRVRENAFPITVICDNIREPGNLGAILRTVTAVGASQIILMKGYNNFKYFFIIFNNYCCYCVFRLYRFMGR